MRIGIAQVWIALGTLAACGATPIVATYEEFVREREVTGDELDTPPDPPEMGLREYLPASFIVHARVIEHGRWRIPSDRGGYQPVSYSVLDVVDRIAGDDPAVSSGRIIVYIEGNFVGPNGECGLMMPRTPRFRDGTPVSGALRSGSEFYDQVGEEMIVFGRPANTYPTARPPELVSEYGDPIAVLAVVPVSAAPRLRQILAE